MIKLKTKNQKPIEVDAHFKYRCPQCGWDHWISLKQAKTKNFKIVCDCDTSFQPKRIKDISIEFDIEHSPPTQKLEPQEQPSTPTVKETVDQPEVKVIITPESKKNIDPLNKEILEKCSKLLVGYGFTSSEAKKLINEAYERINDNNIGLLVKNALEFLGDKQQ